MLVTTKHIFDDCIPRVYPWDVFDWIEEGQTEFYGNLSFHESSITHLPNNMKVEGWLDLTNTNITKLPDNLYVGGNLYIERTNITNLPNDLRLVGGVIR